MSRLRSADVFFGVLLLIIGFFFLALNAGIVPELNVNVWALLASAASLIFLIGWLLIGWRNWPLLFPAVASGSAAVALWTSGSGIDGRLVGGLISLLLALPFWVAFVSDRRHNWWALIPGVILTASSLLILILPVIEDFLAPLILLAVAVPFLIIFLVNRRNWWALIPAYTLVAVGLIVLASSRLASVQLAPLVMFAIALPFLVVFLVDRRKWWALIPASALALVGLVIVLVSQINPLLVRPAIMFAIALPFVVVYVANRENWWALIPAGVLISVGVSALLANTIQDELNETRIRVGVLLAGLAMTFAAVWLLDRRPDTYWAKYPAGILALSAIFVVIFGIRIELIWAIGLVGLGVWLLIRAVLPRRKSKEPEND